MSVTYADAVRRLWSRRAVRLLLIAAAFAATQIPYVRANDFVFAWALCSGLVGLSMNVLVGYAGQISLAHAVLYGSGAFAIGNLSTNQGVPWLISLPLAGLATAGIALVIGFPALRIRGLNLAIATLGFQFAMQRVAFRAKFLTGGAAGIDVERPHISSTPGFFEDNVHLMWVILAVVVLVWTLDRNLTRSRAGRAFLAVRQDEDVAQSFGIPIARTKLLAFAISGLYAGLAGALFGSLIGDVTNEQFDYLFSIEFLVFAVVGGLGSRAGTFIGAAFPVLLARLFELGFQGTLLGALLLVFTLLRYEGGIAAQGRELRHVAALLASRHVALPIGMGVLGVGCFGVALAAGWLAGRAAAVFGPFDDLARIVAGLAAFTVSFRWSLRRYAVAVLTRPATVTEPPEATLPTEPVGVPAQTLGLRRASTTARQGRGQLLEVSDLAIRFGGVRALDGVSLEVRDGELVGIMGPNGSGKTTMLNCISGFLTPGAGEVRFRGRSVLSLAPHTRAALGIGRTFQNVGLAKQETVFDNFLIAQHLVCQYGTFEGLVRTGGVVSEEARLRRRAAAAIELLGLGDVVDERVGSLPHGRAKLVELGCALASGPELLLLDEPAAGVGPQEAEALGRTLKEISSSFGVTILMIEHHVPLMLDTCDYIYVLNFGRLLTHGQPAEVATHPDVIEAYLGTSSKEAVLAAP